MDHFSATELNLFLRCPFSWHMQYEIGIKPPKTDSLIYGIAIHESLEDFYRGKDPVLTLQAFINTNPIVYPSFDKTRYLGQGTQLLEKYKTDSLAIDKIISLEERKTLKLSHPITKEILPIPFTFKIDMICQIAGKTYVLDHKTMQSSSTKQDSFNKNQGVLYTMAYREMFGSRPDGFIQNGLVATKTPRINPIFLQYTEEEEIGIWEKAKEVLAIIKKGDAKDTPPMMSSFYPCPMKILSCPWHSE